MQLSSQFYVPDIIFVLSCFVLPVATLLLVPRCDGPVLDVHPYGVRKS